MKMQDKIKVVIADDNVEFAEILKEFLNHKENRYRQGG